MRLAPIFAALTALLFAFGCARPPAAPPGEALALTAPLPETVPSGVVLRIGDPITQRVLEHTGWDKELPFTVQWAEITGGPAVTEAFHGHALDVGSVANVPPIHATWVGIPVRIIAVRVRKDPLTHPSYVIALSQRSGIRTLADLRGKRIAFSPGQIQGEVVLRTLAHAGVAARDVTLVDLPSTSDVYISALTSGDVDAAPIGTGAASARYIASGGRVLAHGPFRDDVTLLYTPVEVLQDRGKAAALRVYIQYWARAQAWINAHRAEWTDLYYVRNQGLSPADARAITEATGDLLVPPSWDEAIALEQDAINLLAPQTGHAAFDADTLFDRRFEAVIAQSPPLP